MHLPGLFLNIFFSLSVLDTFKHGMMRELRLQCWFSKNKGDKAEVEGVTVLGIVDSYFHRGRWVRRRMSARLRPASFLRTLSKRPPAKGLCRLSVFSADNWSWILWTTATSIARWRQRSAPGKSKPCGLNWTKGHSRRSTTKIKPVKAQGWVRTTDKDSWKSLKTHRDRDRLQLVWFSCSFVLGELSEGIEPIGPGLSTLVKLYQR